MALLQVGACCILDLGLSWLTILGGGKTGRVLLGVGEIYPPNWCWICLDDMMPSSPSSVRSRVQQCYFCSAFFVFFCYSGARANMVGNMALYL